MKIHEFDPLIYPRKLWVVVGTDTFSDRFEGVSEWDDAADAIVDCVYDKQKDLGGVLVRFKSKKSMTVSTISHESLHIAMNIFDYIGAKADSMNQEPLAYLVGWIAGKINQVRICKLKE
ncbi:hypothetical protein [Bacteroides pyogenes]|uniref:hypothetical protein n=1 Tax=Bacteroides pyogenes TaxID=310300 RepID=UPI001BA5196E|nr:hypothetical protein [Bacteroides pyogenes]MBR8706941.1 hypothetical protein [Bacteroides pyogenes]